MLYLAYGMNTNNNQMNPAAQRLGPALLEGFAWEMLQYANVYQSVNDSTIGILWEIDDAVLYELDIREGYPAFYNRILVDVIHNKQIKSAWVYTMTPGSRDLLKEQTPSKYYFDCVVEGYACDNLTIPPHPRQCF
jgi:gamma-glutamylcyclotransferase (GGCT)/AIG2-like uncharacterized protein YtfP